MTEIPKAYSPKEIENKIYERWERSGFFNSDNLRLPENAEKFTIAMPPPNVTGVLHLGHALENALMDTMIRFQRMRGRRALLIPGTDHAAVATQARVENDLIKSGKYKNPRQELGREKLLEIIRAYAEKSKATILSQIRKMGVSCDWSRLAYTFDEERSKAVNEIFVKMYNDGLIYRGYRVVNWSVRGQSTCSDEELVYVERPAKLYTFKYSKDFPIPIATTRPETKLGDAAVAVNPKGKWKKYIGKTYEIKNFADSVDLKIKVIADSGVDMKFGTGALGVTPAHSMVDFEMYKKDNDIDFIQVIDKEGLMTLKAGREYQHLSVEEARKKIVMWLSENKLLEKEEDIIQNVSTSDRFGDIVEVIPMTQWFVKVDKEVPSRGKSLKDLMRDVVTIGHGGDKKQKIKITPDRFRKIYLHWIDNLKDWCISRQIWWGHRIPVWYDLALEEYEKYKDNTKAFGEFLNYTEPARKGIGSEKPSADGNWLQDPDTLDTWFSSGTWTFSTLGWPDKTEDLKMYHPTSWMQMGSEIIFFWMARMILMSTYALNQIPFREVYIHGILRDKDGRKFSKSLGNGIDPVRMIEKYGTDALRLSLITGITHGNDARFYEEKVEGYRNFVNKLWNISRYIMGKRDSGKNCLITLINPDKCSIADNWILRKMMNLICDARHELENSDFSAASDKLKDFTWSDFADWYIEISKIENNEQKSLILNVILEDLLRLWHPFIPFVTEEIWKKMGKDKLLMVEKWPDEFPYEKILKKAETPYHFTPVIEIVKSIRNLRSEYKIEPIRKIKAIFITRNEHVKYLLKTQEPIIKGLARLESFDIRSEKGVMEKSVAVFVSGADIYLPLEDLVDVEKEKANLSHEAENIKSYINQLKNKLSNEKFVSNAPCDIVKKEKEKLAQSKEKLAKLEEKLKSLL